MNMYCPKCSQQQVSDDVRFCSRCGFLLTGIAEVIENDGMIPGASKQVSRNPSTPRKKGFKQGLFGLLLLILTSPIFITIGQEFEIHPSVLFLTFFMVFIACVIRMIFAGMFESNEPDFSPPDDFESAPDNLAGKRKFGSLPQKQAKPVADFIPPVQGNWRNSNDLAYSSVTDVTTQQLDKK